MSSVVSATEIKFDLSKLTAEDFPRVKGQSSAAALVVLPKVVVQCPYGPADKPITWSRVSWRKLAGVMRQLHVEAQAVRSDLKGWTFDMEDLTPEDYDFIEAAVFRNHTRDGARMIAKYAVGVPTEVMAEVMQRRAETAAAEAAKAEAGKAAAPAPQPESLRVPDAASLAEVADIPEEDGTATGGDTGALTATDVLKFPYYRLYSPLINRLREEARKEFQTGFLDALSATPAVS